MLVTSWSVQPQKVHAGHALSLLVRDSALQGLRYVQVFEGCWLFSAQFFIVDFQVQSILKRLETPYSDDMEDEASVSQTATTESSPSLADHKERTIFNVYDKHEHFDDKPPEDVLNMRLS